MTKKILRGFIIFLALFSGFFAQPAKAQTITSRNFGERFVVRSIGNIHGAQMTYQATAGNGTYGSLQNLHAAGFIDAALASGEKHGYIFTLAVTPATATVPAKFSLTATPRLYRKPGRLSYFVDERGEVRGADKNGAPADANDPVIDTCNFYGDAAGNERCVIQNLRTLHSAQMTYQATTGGGNYGTLAQLFAANLINSRMAGGALYGYAFTLQTVSQSPNAPAFFSLRATPVNYGVSGTRSFYIDETGVLRGANRQGAPAGPTDPPIND